MALFTPIKTLVDMNVRTKSTYRAALEGIDMSMVQILNDMKYSYEDTKIPNLNYRPTDVRMEMTKARLEAFKKDHRIGIADFIQYATHTFHRFLEVYYIGNLHELRADADGHLRVTISCLLHQGFSTAMTSAREKFERQLQYLADCGITVEQCKNMGHWQILDNDSNRKALKFLLESKGARLLEMTSRLGYIYEINFLMWPTTLVNFKTDKDFDKPAITDELNEDEMAQVKKFISEIPSSMGFALNNPMMVSTCGYVAETTFASLCETVGYEGTIAKRVHERHKVERAQNLSIRDIERKIGMSFPADTFKETIDHIHHNLNFFAADNLHGAVKEMKIDQWGHGRVTFKWVCDLEDLRYYINEEDFDNHCYPSDETYENVFKMTPWDGYGVLLLDTEENRKALRELVEIIPGIMVEGFRVALENLNPGARDLCTINEMDILIDDFSGIIQWYEDKNMQPPVKSK